MAGERRNKLINAYYRDDQPLYFGSDKDVSLTFDGTNMNATGDWAFSGTITGTSSDAVPQSWTGTLDGSQSINLLNESTGTSASARYTVTSDNVSLAIWSADNNNTLTLLTGDISGGRHIIRALGDHPIQFGVNQLKVGAFTSTGFEIWQPGSTTDKVAISHDGTDFNFDFTNTTSARFTNSLGGRIIALKDSGGAGAAANPHIGFEDSADTLLAAVGFLSGGNSTLYFDNNSGAIELDAVGANNIILRPNTGAVRIIDNGYTDWCDMSHDGTDFNYAYNQTGTVNNSGADAYQFDGNNVLQGDTTTGKTIYRCIQWDCRAGSTPGTNINISLQNAGNEGFNEPTVNNATNLAASGTSGDFSLDASALALTLDLTESIVHVGPISVSIGDHQSSTADPIYMRQITNGNNVSFYVYTDGSSGAQSWLTHLASGDVVYFQCVLITNS
jgi:hypothetical protein